MSFLRCIFASYAKLDTHRQEIKQFAINFPKPRTLFYNTLYISKLHWIFDDFWGVLK